MPRLKESELLKYISKKPLLLAPMAGVTDYPFRSFIREMGAGILTTELVSSVALVRHEAKRTPKIAFFTEDQQPIGVQIFGEDPDILSQAALRVEQMGAGFVDLNLGCPVPKIVKKGAGSALLKNLPLLGQILKSIKSKINIPLTIKIRTGWDEDHRNALDTAQIAFNEGCLWMTIHGRTRKQAYSGLADWSYIAEVKSKAPLPIIGNGDLINPLQIQDLYFKTKCDGLMIGRGCLKNPWIFQQAYQLIKNTQQKNPPASSDSLSERNSQLDLEQGCLLNPNQVLEKLFSHLESFYDERMTLLQFKKFSVWFSSGCPDSTLFRKTVFQMKEKEAVLKYVFDYFQNFDLSKKENAPYEPFLLQGHG